jgi:hypothetical protein
MHPLCCHEGRMCGHTRGLSRSTTCSQGSVLLFNELLIHCTVTGGGRAGAPGRAEGCGEGGQGLRDQVRRAMI